VKKIKNHVSDSLFCSLVNVLIITKFRYDLFNNYLCTLLCTMRTGRSPINLISTIRSSNMYLLYLKQNIDILNLTVILTKQCKI